MKAAKGFFLLQTIVVFTLGLLLLLATLRIYRECYLTLQQKLLLEQAFATAQQSLVNEPAQSKFELAALEQDSPMTNLHLKELQVSYHGKTLFTLVEVR